MVPLMSFAAAIMAHSLSMSVVYCLLNQDNAVIVDRISFGPVLSGMSCKEHICRAQESRVCQAAFTDFMH